MVLPRTPATGSIPVLSDKEREAIEAEMEKEAKELKAFISHNGAERK